MNHMLVTVTGPDHPGITASLMDIIVQNNNTLCDLGQAVTHGLLSLSFFIEFKQEEDKNELIKSLLFCAKTQGLDLNYQIIDEKDSFSHQKSPEKFVLNCISTDKIRPRFLKDLSSLLAKNKINIQRIENLTPETFKSLEISTGLPEDLDMADFKKGLLGVSTTHRVDLAFLKDNVFRRSKRLVVFDMDSTLIQSEVIDEMADVIGQGERVRKITEKTMNGEMDFDESLRQRVALLEGIKIEQMQEILDHLKLTPGAETFIKKIKDLGYKVALISGGFSFFANALKEKLGLDYSFSNELEIKQNVLTGKISGAVIDAKQKEILLKLIAQLEKISLEQVVAIGDGANDLPMLSTAGLGIAFHAKDIVKRKAGHHMSHGPMTSILYFLGIKEN